MDNQQHSSKNNPNTALNNHSISKPVAQAPSTSFTSALPNNSMAEFTLMYQQQLAMAQMLAANPYLTVGFYPGMANPFLGGFPSGAAATAATTWPGLDYASLLGMASPAAATAPTGLLTPPNSVAIGGDFMETLAKLPTSLPPKSEPNNNSSKSNNVGAGPSSSSQKSPVFALSLGNSVKSLASTTQPVTIHSNKSSAGISVTSSPSGKRLGSNSHSASTATAESTSKPRVSSVIVENRQHSSGSKSSANNNNSYHLHNGGLEALADAALQAAAEEDKIASFIDSVVNSVVSSPAEKSKDPARNSRGPKLTNAVLLDPKTRQPKTVISFERKPTSPAEAPNKTASSPPPQNQQQQIRWDLNLLNASLAEALKSNPQLDPNLLAVLESNPYLFSGIQASLLNAQKAVTSIVSAPIKCEMAEESSVPPKKRSSLDLTIDSVINGAIQAAYAAEEKSSPSPVSSRTPKTVKEQLARKRASESPLDLSLKSPPPPSSSAAAGLLLVNGLKDESSSRTPSTLSEASAVGTGQKRRISWSECGEQNNRDTPTPTKRKRRKADESLCRIPLEQGWKRETLIRDITASGIKGDVSYVAPCGKKLATYSDLMRYLVKHPESQVGKQHFSFSSKIPVGDYLQPESAEGKKFIRLSAEDIQSRIEQLFQKVGTSRSCVNNSSVSDAKAEERVVERKSGGSLESASKSAADVLEAKDDGLAADNSPPPGKLEAEKNWLRRRLERDRMKAILNHSGNNKHLHRFAGKNSSVLAKKRRDEERRRLLAEKLIRREERMKARNQLLLRARQRRQPVDDLEVLNGRPFPDLERIADLRIDGRAFADCLMVLEFVQNFAHVLKIDLCDVPSLGELQLGLLNEPRHVPALLRLTKILLTLVLEYPGAVQTQTGQQARTSLGQTVRDLDVTSGNLTELLRIYLGCRDAEAQQLSTAVAEVGSYELLEPSTKAAILGQMCNELLYCRNVVREIETNIDVVAKLKGDKWAAEGQLRQIRSKDQQRQQQQQQGLQSERKATTTTEELDECEADPSVVNGSSGNATELHSKIDSLAVEIRGLREKITSASAKVRSVPYGQDRHYRNYWVLQRAGGVLVESLESAAPFDPLEDPHGGPNLESEVRFCLDRMVEVVERKLDTYEFTDDEPDADEFSSDFELFSLMDCGDDPGVPRQPIPGGFDMGWWRLSNATDFTAAFQALEKRGIRERCLSRQLERHKDYISKHAFRTDAFPLLPCASSREEMSAAAVQRNSALRLLHALRSFEEKILHASVNVKCWRPPDLALSASNCCPDNDVSRDSADSTSSTSSSECDFPAEDGITSTISTERIVEQVKERLLTLEINIERRYLKPPLMERAEIRPALFNGETESAPIEQRRPSTPTETEQLLAWRAEVENATQAAQLHLCMQYLEANIAWERSAMKAYCQMCAGGENDSHLLLCDGCDRGYHTYCFRPKMDRVPDGEWFCPQCISKVSDTPCCCMCQQQADDLWDCAKCFRYFHADCALEPAGECPKLWTCRICAPKPNQNGLTNNAKRGGKYALVRTSAKLKGRTGGGRDSMPNSCDNGSLISAAEFGQNQLLKKRQNHLEELLNVIMADLDAHKGAWPFRSPVDTKAFPMYRKVIKKPMDLASMQHKLNAHKYQSEEEFVADVELIFTNCHKFNEDDSPVGKAAQSLRRFFKRRWQELKRLQKTKISTFRRSF